MTVTGGRRAGIALAGDPDYDAATQVFNLHAPAHPVAAVTAHTVQDVRAAMRFARTERLAVRVHSTGHGAGAARAMGDAVLIRTQLDGGVRVDPQRRLARVPAGTRWAEVVDAAAAYGLAAPHGTSAGVGVVGYSLRGGISVYGRKVGLAVNSVRAVELVTADDELRRVDLAEDPDLFWAVRGGGGGFGVVTAIEIALFPARRVTTGATYWSGTRAAEVMDRWRAWTAGAPPEATTSLQVLNLPDAPVVPDSLKAGTMIGVAGTILGTELDPRLAWQQAQSLLSPLRTIGEPLLDTWQLCSPGEVAHAQLAPNEPGPMVGDHMLFGDLGDRGAATFLDVTGPGSGSPLISAELRHLGGAFAVPADTGGAFRHLDAAYAYLGTAVPDGPDGAAAIEKHCAVVRAALAPWDTGRTTPTLVESVSQPQAHLDPDVVDAVDRVRLRVDPDGLFRDDIVPGSSRLR
ncbi:FAD-binding oxidoreductase [Micromonospora peucetia]|uniref:FAD-binding protein n=1 Tax=Micromonospora peucetia TaxID=47871 RepID=A0ABZ1E8U7_9ACTN|nr:FAD-binding protein [Micromonospora peucetia]WSA31238.1 FAD-binding protein [Micromonospora peucetia]